MGIVLYVLLFDSLLSFVPFCHCNLNSGITDEDEMWLQLLRNSAGKLTNPLCPIYNKSLLEMTFKYVFEKPESSQLSVVVVADSGYCGSCV